MDSLVAISKNEEGQDKAFVDQVKQNENKQAVQKVVLRVKRKANEDPLETLIIEGEMTQNKKQKPNPLFGFNFLEKMLNDLSIQNANLNKEKENETQNPQTNLFKNEKNEEEQQKDTIEKKQYILTLVDKDNDAVKQIKEAKMMYAENNRKRARDRLIEKNRRHRFLDLTVDAASKEVKVEKPNLSNQNEEEEGEYAYYEVEERKIIEQDQDKDNQFQNIGNLLSKEQDNIMRIQSGFIHLVQNQNPSLFAGEFDPYRSDDFSDKDSQDSNRESAEDNDYPDEEDVEEEMEDEDKYYKGEEEDYDDYGEDQLPKKKSKKKKNTISQSIHGIYLGNQSSDEQSNSMDQEKDDNFEDNFNKKYNNYYHKKYDNDFNDDDYED